MLINLIIFYCTKHQSNAYLTRFSFTTNSASNFNKVRRTLSIVNNNYKQVLILNLVHTVHPINGDVIYRYDTHNLTIAPYQSSKIFQYSGFCNQSGLVERWNVAVGYRTKMLVGHQDIWYYAKPLQPDHVDHITVILDFTKNKYIVQTELQGTEDAAFEVVNERDIIRRIKSSAGKLRFTPLLRP